MFGLISRKQVVEEVKRRLTDACMIETLGFGKQEKMRAVGKIQGLSRLLEEYFCVKPGAINNLREQTHKTAETNLMSYSVKREDYR
jgi:hypothetical protein